MRLHRLRPKLFPLRFTDVEFHTEVSQIVGVLSR
jgi:hypothetical protein